MPKVKAILTTDKEIYQIGEVVTGVVTIEVIEPCKCNDLLIIRSWSSSGKGNKTGGGGKSLSLFKGEWEKGTYTYPFTMGKNPGPVSYEGIILNIHWSLELVADINWATDTKVTHQYRVKKSENEEEKYNFRFNAGISQHQNDFLKIKSFLIKFSPIILLYFSYLLFKKGDDLLGFVTLCGAAYMGYRENKVYIAQLRTGKIKCTVDKANYLSGERVKYKLNFTPKTNMKINEIKIKLIGREVATHTKVPVKGTNKGFRNTKTYEHILYEQEYVLNSEHLIRKGLPFEHKKHFDLPEGAPRTLLAYHNEIRWQIVTELDIEGWPNWKESIPIKVF